MVAFPVINAKPAAKPATIKLTIGTFLRIVAKVDEYCFAKARTAVPAAPAPIAPTTLPIFCSTFSP